MQSKMSSQTAKNISIPKHEIKAERCKRSLFYFLKEFWGTINSKEYEDNFHIEFLCDKIQMALEKYVIERPSYIPKHKWYEGFGEHVSKNLVYTIPPGTSKTTILSRMAPAWLWAIDSTKTWISSTIDRMNATEFSTSTMEILNSDLYRLYFPEVSIRRDVSAKMFYQSTRGGRRYSLTTKGSNTGKHGDVISEDDAMDYNTAQSATEAKRCIDGWISLQTRKKDKSKTVYILGMQKLSNRDTVAHALKSLTDVDYVCLPAEDIHNNIVPPEMAKYYKDGLLDPNRLSRKNLEDVKKGLTQDSLPIPEIAFNIQFNQVNQTTESLLYTIKLVELPEDRSQAIRFSFTDVKDEGKDYFGTIFCEINNGKIYVFDAIYTQEKAEFTSVKLKAKTELHNIHFTWIESNNMGSVFAKMLKMMGMQCHSYTSSGNKPQRISAMAQLSPFVRFAIPGSEEFHTPEYSHAIKHMQAYPQTGLHEDEKDDIEDAFTEMLINFFRQYKQLFAPNQSEQ